MKTKFHLSKRTPSRFNSSSSNTPAAPSQAVALVDERYLGWLASQHGLPANAPLQRTALMPVLTNVLRQMQPESQLLRTCLFTDQSPTELLDDLLLRTVPQHSADGGLGLVRSLGLELAQLAQRGACQVVVLVSDDERLIPYIDDAQWRGLKVVLVADESSQDFAKFRNDDPSWARLLAQADRRVALSDSAWQALTTPGMAFVPSRSPEPLREDDAVSAESYFAAPPPSDDWRTQVQQVISEWWAEETEDTRLDLFEEMQNSQGVPPETDRHLLLRVRRELARTLSFQEKKAMREMIRATVFAQPPTVSEPAAGGD
jgi:hypothetical protein